MLAFQLTATECALTCTPVPDTASVNVLFASLATVIVPLAPPRAVGANVVLSDALCPAASTVLDPIPLTANPAPLTDTPEIVMFVFPLFVSVAASELLLPKVTSPKVRLDGFKPSNRVLVTPVPVREIASGEFTALLVSEIDPLALPLALAVKVMLNALLCPAAITNGRFNPDVPNPVPATATFVIVALAFPLFDTVTVCELVDPTATFGKLADVGVTDRFAVALPPPEWFPGVVELVATPAHPLRNSEPKSAIAIATKANRFAPLKLPAFGRFLTHDKLLRSDPETGIVRQV